MPSQPKESKPGQVLLRWGAIVLGILGIALLLVFIAIHEVGPEIHGIARDRTAKLLQVHFESEVEFSDFEISLFPRVKLTITGLVMRHEGRTDIPPLFQIRKITAYAHLLSLLRPNPRIELVVVEGLQIHTPPRHPGGTPLIHGTDQDLAKKYPLIIDELRADDATLTILRDQPGKPTREFPIYHLQLHDLSFDRPASFHAVLENALPTGDIDTAGQFGPWSAEEPANTPAVGQYTFQNADLGTLKGIKGTLSSTGSFSGPLNYLTVEGATDTPDFALRTTDHPMMLHTDFSAIVDGTNGNTYLKSVTAQFLHTTLIVSGEVVDADRAIKGRTIILDAISRGARVEDFMRLAAKGNEPVMTGSVRLQAKINIPEGNSDLIDRLRINGQFGINDGQFTNSGVQEKIDTLSRKGRGQPKDANIQSVASETSGHFHMSDAVLSFSSLEFGVNGASINLDGTYNVDNENLDFHGKLMLRAKLSQTTTGAKSFFLRALDPFFKGKNAGTVLPIKITGTRENPSFGLDHGGDSEKSDSPPLKKGE